MEIATCAFIIGIIIVAWILFANYIGETSRSDTASNAKNMSARISCVGRERGGYTEVGTPIATSSNFGWFGAGAVLTNPVLPMNPAVAATIASNPGAGYRAPIVVGRGAIDAPYERVGLLTATNGNGANTLLSLMGRPLNTNGLKWQYYTTSDQFNSVRVPISIGGKNAAGEYGVNELQNGDTVYVDGLNTLYTATMYETSSLRYMPIF